MHTNKTFLALLIFVFSTGVAFSHAKASKHDLPNADYNKIFCDNNENDFLEWLNQMQITEEGRRELKGLYSQPNDIKSCRANWLLFQGFMESTQFRGYNQKSTIDDRRHLFRYSNQARFWREKERSYQQNESYK